MTLRPLPDTPEDHDRKITLIHAPEQEESSGVSIIQPEIHTEDRARKSANYLNVYTPPPPRKQPWIQGRRENRFGTEQPNLHASL